MEMSIDLEWRLGGVCGVEKCKVKFVIWVMCGVWSFISEGVEWSGVEWSGVVMGVVNTIVQ